MKKKLKCLCTVVWRGLFAFFIRREGHETSCAPKLAQTQGRSHVPTTSQPVDRKVALSDQNKREEKPSIVNLQQRMKNAEESQARQQNERIRNIVVLGLLHEHCPSLSIGELAHLLRADTPCNPQAKEFVRSLWTHPSLSDNAIQAWSIGESRESWIVDGSKNRLLYSVKSLTWRLCSLANSIY